FSPCSRILALRFARLDRCGSGYPADGLSPLGAAFCASGKRHTSVSGHRRTRHLSASRQHRSPCSWRGAEVFFQQEGPSVKKIAILGAGSWGTALAIVLTRSRQPHRISLWAHDPELAEFLRRERANSTYLPGHK